MNYIKQVIAFIKSHWGAILAFLVALWAQFGSVVIAYVQAHPHLSLIYSLIAFTVVYYYKRKTQAYYYQKSIAPTPKDS